MPRAAKMEPKWAKMAPRWDQDEAMMTPRRTKMMQNGAKMAPRWSETGPRWNQDIKRYYRVALLG